MKITLDANTASKITTFLTELRATDPTITRSMTVAVNQFVQELISGPTKSQRESLKGRLVSTKTRKTSLVRGIHDDLDENDPEQLQAVERLRAELRKLREKKPKLSDGDANE